jgi:hypothetical protein
MFWAFHSARPVNDDSQPFSTRVYLFLPDSSTSLLNRNYHTLAKGKLTTVMTSCLWLSSTLVQVKTPSKKGPEKDKPMFELSIPRFPFASSPQCRVGCLHAFSATMWHWIRMLLRRLLLPGHTTTNPHREPPVSFFVLFGPLHPPTSFFFSILYDRMKRKEVLKWMTNTEQHREKTVLFTMESPGWCGWEAEASETACAFQCQIVATKAWTDEERWWCEAGIKHDMVITPWHNVQCCMDKALNAAREPVVPRQHPHRSSQPWHFNYEILITADLTTRLPVPIVGFPKVWWRFQHGCQCVSSWSASQYLLVQMQDGYGRLPIKGGGLGTRRGGEKGGKEGHLRSKT